MYHSFYSNIKFQDCFQNCSVNISFPFFVYNHTDCAVFVIKRTQAQFRDIRFIELQNFHGKGVCLFITELYLCTFPAPDFVKGFIVLCAHLSVLIVEAVRYGGFPRTEISRPCQVVRIILAVVKVVEM